MRDETIAEFLTQLASRTSAPGGGAAAGLHAAQAAALIAMVARYSDGPRRDPAAVGRIRAAADGLIDESLGLAEADAAAFREVAAAYRFPKETEEDRSKRSDAISRARTGATRPPADLMAASARLAGLAEEMLAAANRDVISDLAAAAASITAAALTARVTIEANLTGVRDERLKTDLTDTAALADEVTDRAARLIDAVRDEMSALRDRCGAGHTATGSDSRLIRRQVLTRSIDSIARQRGNAAGNADQRYKQRCDVSELAAPPRKVPEKVRSDPGSGFRPDIQGLRAIAVAMVVIYHLWPARLPGGFAGVDVFFVISGYLITSHLWRGFSATGRLSLVDFWGRRARRLVPAAAIVLAATWIASRLMLPATRLADTAQQILASALYFQNWQLAHESVDYLQSNDAATPVQHFWSLSVEEQFYLVWPLLFLLAALIAAAVARGSRQRRGQHSKQRPEQRERTRATAVRVLTAALVAGSLAYSVWDTNHDPSAAYFVTTTRMWELGIGGLLALAPAPLGRLLGRQGWLGWLGLAAVVASAFTLTGTMPFPGDLALLPVLGAAALIAGGSADARFGPARVMSARPMVFLGGISYSLYLWHFPVINLFTQWHGKAPGLVTGPALAAVAVLLAWATKIIVEDPVRLARALRGHGWRSVSTALAAAVPVAMAAVFIVGEPPPWNGQLGPDYPGAAVLAAKVEGKKESVPAKPVLPPPTQAAQPSYWRSGCLDGEFVATPKPCVFGDTKDPKATVVLVGDSVAGNWWAAMAAIATREHWKLVTYLHATCAWSAAPATPPQKKPGPYTPCNSWGRAVTSELLKTKPQLVVTSSMATETAAGYGGDASKARAVLGAGEAQYWNELKRDGVPVVAIRETPTIGVAAPTCVAKYGEGSSKCATSKSKSILKDPPTATATKDSDVPVVDMNDLICGSKCRSAVGNVLVYFDDHHMTQAYSQTLAPYLLQRLAATGVAPKT